MHLGKLSFVISTRYIIASGSWSMAMARLGEADIVTMRDVFSLLKTDVGMHYLQSWGANMQQQQQQSRGDFAAGGPGGVGDKGGQQPGRF